MAIKTEEAPRGIGNSIFTIHPYKKEGQWQFDDPSRDVYNEAFVAGADDLLDILTDGANKCTAMFSENSFPDHQLALILKKTDETGSDYYCEKYNHNLWLCPALYLYYPKAPQNIYLKIK